MFCLARPSNSSAKHNTHTGTSLIPLGISSADFFPKLYSPFPISYSLQTRLNTLSMLNSFTIFQSYHSWSLKSHPIPHIPIWLFSISLPEQAHKTVHTSKYKREKDDLSFPFCACLGPASLSFFLSLCERALSSSERPPPTAFLSPSRSSASFSTRTSLSARNSSLQKDREKPAPFWPWPWLDCDWRLAEDDFQGVGEEFPDLRLGRQCGFGSRGEWYGRRLRVVVHGFGLVPLFHGQFFGF